MSSVIDADTGPLSTSVNATQVFTEFIQHMSQVHRERLLGKNATVRYAKDAFAGATVHAVGTTMWFRIDWVPQTLCGTGVHSWDPSILIPTVAPVDCRLCLELVANRQQALF